MATAIRDYRVPLVKLVFAVFLALHGVLHLAGVSGNAKLIADHEAARLLGGALVVSNHAVLAALAGAWAGLAAAFMAASLMVWREARTARRMIVTVSVLSLALCVVSLWATVVGVFVDVALIAVAFERPRLVGIRDGKGGGRVVYTSPAIGTSGPGRAV